MSLPTKNYVKGPSTEETPLLLESVPLPIECDTKFYILQKRVYILVFLIIMLVQIGEFIQAAPSSKVLEEIICRNYFTATSNATGSQTFFDAGEGKRCKSKAVQSELAMLRGWTMTIDYLPGIFVAIPYGYMADKHGRKWVLSLGILGILLNCACYYAVCWWSNIFPVKVTWATSVFNFIGGGSAVLTSTVFTVVSDVTSEENRLVYPLRSTTFFYIASSVLVGELIASAIASLLLTWSPWLPILVGLGCISLALGVALALPETLDARVSNGIVPSDLSNNEDEANLEGSDIHWYRKARASLTSLSTAATHFVWGNKRVALLLSTFALTIVGRYVSEILMQYATKRYNWTWARAGILLSLRSFTALILLVAILPLANYLLTARFSLSAQSKDLWLARVSIILSMIGSLTIGMSGTPSLMAMGVVVWAVGAGYSLLVRSLLTSLVEPHHVGTLNSTMAMLETIGSLLGGPLLSLSFRKGLDLGGIWLGLPFIGAGILSFIAALVIWLIHLPPPASAFKASNPGTGNNAEDIQA